MSMIQPGDMLVATRQNRAPAAQKAILLVLEVRDLIWAVTVNKPVPGIALSNFWVANAPAPDGCFHYGGPFLANDHGLVHTFPELGDSVPVRDGIFWRRNNWNFTPLLMLDAEQAAQADRYRCYFGFFIWSPADLSHTIDAGELVVFPAGTLGAFSRYWTGVWEELMLP